jgi:tetrathionate reductase subunit B
MAPTPQYAMVIDLDRCAGCHACSVACKSEHDVPLGQFRTRVEAVELGRFPKVKRHFIPTLCNQCKDAPCIPACPTDAIFKAENGIVQIDQNSCVGEMGCMAACPYDAIYLNPETGTADKCDFCSDRLADGGQPACVATCPTQAFTFGNLANPDDPIHALIADRQPTGLKAAAGTGPQVLYLGLADDVEKRIDGINPARPEDLYRVKRG